MGGERQQPCERDPLGRKQRTVYQIRVEGHLDLHWSRQFGGSALDHEGDGTTTLTITVADQPALHGLLIKIRDLGLELVSVLRLGREAELSETGPSKPESDSKQ